MASVNELNVPRINDDLDEGMDQVFPIEVTNMNRTVCRKHTKKEFKNTESYKIFIRIFDFISLIGSPVGLKLSYDLNPIKNKMFCATISYMCSSAFLQLYTKYMHIHDGNYIRVLEIAALYGVLSSIYLKITSYLKHRHNMLALVNSTRRLCKMNLAAIRSELLRRHLNRFYPFCKLFTCSLLSSGIFYFFAPVKSYFIDHKLLSLCPIEMFIDQTTFKGYVIANSYFALGGLLAYLISIFYSLIFAFCIVIVSLHVDLINEDLKELDEMWKSKRKTTEKYRHAFLSNVCKKVQDKDTYVNEIKFIFEDYIFKYFFFNYLSQIICCFEVTKNAWLPGYGVAFALFYEMMFYCSMGSFLTHCNERLSDSIYAANWHTYDLNSQKIVLQLLHQSQNCRDLWIGPFRRLDVITGIEVVKSIYSYYTILQELF